MIESRQNDFRGERQRSDCRPRSDGAVIRSKGDAACPVVEKVSSGASHCPNRWPRAVARGDAPAVLAVAAELSGIPDRVLPLDVGGTPAVLEIVDSPLAHVIVLDAAEIQPGVRELMDEKRAGVQELGVVELLPA